MLAVILVWLVTVILPLLYMNSLFAYYPPHQTIRDVVIAMFVVMPFAWLAIYLTIGRIQRSDDMSRLLRLEQLLRGLNDTDLDQLRQRLSDNPDTELYESIEDLLAAQKRKNR
ncbi:MAG: hypothetical protein H7X77_02425 [Anaerolineae bacterium]|nr:hypothetical protein [Anaerolineae bacterium]